MPCLEVIADTVEDAIAAESGGATRIAILSHYPSSGITPSYGMVARIREKVKIPLVVLICPHTRGYIPSHEDLEICLRDIDAFKKLGVNDFLLGFIDQSGSLNIAVIETIKAAHNGIHLHSRVIWELTKDIRKTVETTISLGFHSMRTSGNCLTNSLTNGDFTKNLQNISLIKETAKDRIEILLTGGITARNVETFLRQTTIYNLQIGRGVRTPSNSHSPVDPLKVAAIRSKQISIFEEHLSQSR